MDALLNNIAILVETITENLYLFILMMVFVCSKEFRIAGIILLTLQVTIGYNRWIYVIVITIALSTNYMRPRAFYKHEYEKKLEEYQKAASRKSKVIRMDNSYDE